MNRIGILLLLGVLAAYLLVQPAAADRTSHRGRLRPLARPGARGALAPCSPASKAAQAAGATLKTTLANPRVAAKTDKAAAANPQQAAKPAPPALVWHTDYRVAVEKAELENKMLLIFFHEPCPNAATRAFENHSLADKNIVARLKGSVLAKLPRNAQIRVKGRSISLLSHAAFAEMLGRQGVAILDYAHREKSYYGHVVSTFPFTPGKYYLPSGLAVVLDLPAGTLTQRTMIYAVRIHPEAPASAHGRLHTVLVREAQKHSTYQASITLQGHHAWESRFHHINSQLPSGMMAQEVVAESWPNEHLVEACVDCVHSWRQSPGHWGAVRARQSVFGYDIKRGRNGIWYATGIFGRR